MLLTASVRRNEVGTLGWVSRADTKARVYLNFAEDWRRDFTIMVERKDAKVLQEAGLDVKALAGKRLRVRGWIQWRNGPMIRVTHVEQIELLTEAPGTTALPNPPGAPAPRLQQQSEPDDIAL